MKNRKNYPKILIAATAAMLCMTGCNNANGGTETQSETVPQTTTETQAVLEKVTYTSADGNISIILPDSNWTNTKDADGVLSFASDTEGEITVEYADTKKKVNQFVKAVSEKKLNAKLKKLGVDPANTTIRNFTYDKSSAVKTCSYAMRYSQPVDGSFDVIRSISFTDTQGYQITGLVKKDDSESVNAIQSAVDSVMVLKPLETAETDSATESDSSDSGNAEEGERYFFDEAGKTIYVDQNADGNWVDKDGVKYTFYETWVEDGNGTVYYYDPPAYRGDSSDQSASDGQNDGADYYDFYDRNGKYIKATQDENGKWVGDDGKTYTFGEDGVTDSDGNFNPY